jgi:hypothetical protein
VGLDLRWDCRFTRSPESKWSQEDATVITSLAATEINGFQVVQAVPEPATWAMLLGGLGLLGGVRRFRRARKV